MRFFSVFQYITKRAASWGVKVEKLYELEFDIPQTYKSHKHGTLNIEVDFIRFSHPENKKNSRGCKR